MTEPTHTVVVRAEATDTGQWTRDRIEAVWDVFARAGLELDRASMYYDEGADSEFCERHRRLLAETLDRAQLVVRGAATDTDSMEARIEHAGEPSPELLADLTLSAADTFERVHGRKPSRVLVEVLPWDAADTDYGPSANGARAAAQA
jgi:hypothetical protein